MQLPRSVRERTQAGTDEQAAGPDQSSRSRLGRARTVLVAVVTAVVAYVAVRWLRSGSDAEMSDIADDIVPGEASKIPIGEPSRGDEGEGDDGESEAALDSAEEAASESESIADAAFESESETDTEPQTADGDEDGDSLDELSENDTVAEDRSDEEIAERATEDVRDEPAEPGEMAVDEDVVSDLVDEDTETDEE